MIKSVTDDANPFVILLGPKKRDWFMHLFHQASHSPGAMMFCCWVVECIRVTSISIAHEKALTWATWTKKRV